MEELRRRGIGVGGETARPGGRNEEEERWMDGLRGEGERPGKGEVMEGVSRYLFPDVAGTNVVGLPRLTRRDGLVAGTGRRGDPS